MPGLPDKGLRALKSLDVKKSDEKGKFDLSFERSDLLDPDRGVPNLEVKVTDRNGKPLVRPQQRFNARPVERFIFQVIDQPEIERLDAKLSKALDRSRLEELDDQQLEFLSQTTRIPKARIQARHKAKQLSAETKLPEWFYYSLMRQGITKDVDQLLDESDDRLKKILQAAKADDTQLISPPSDADIDQAFERIAELRAERLIKQPLPGRRIKTMELLEAGAVDPANQVKLGRALAGKPLWRRATWREAVKAAGLDPQMEQRVTFAFESARLTDDHAATVKALNAKLAADGKEHSVRELAKSYDLKAWESLVAQSNASDLPPDLPGDTVEKKRENFARRIYDRVASAYPSLSFTYGLKRSPEQRVSNDPAVSLLEKILEKNAEFELDQARVKPYLKEKATELALNSDNKLKEATEKLQRLQRVFRLDRDPARAAVLLKSDLDSASKIAAKGSDRFLDEVTKDNNLDKRSAKAIYDRSVKQVTENIGILTAIRQEIVAPTLPSIAKEQALDTENPDYKALFGSLDSCGVEHCASVLSPAAYLADLLSFIQREIQGPDSGGGTVSGLDALTDRYRLEGGKLKLVDPPQARRPDIAEIELSCINSDTPLPYVDLVMEILEQAAAGSTTGHSHQTELSAEQLGALPEHFNAQAYENLAQAVFPLSLPFDIWHAESGLLLPELGTSHSELLETFRPLPAIDPATTDLDKTFPNRTVPGSPNIGPWRGLGSPVCSGT